jgi:hypothetical protein
MDMMALSLKVLMLMKVVLVTETCITLGGRVLILVTIVYLWHRDGLHSLAYGLRLRIPCIGIGMAQVGILD